MVLVKVPYTPCIYDVRVYENHRQKYMECVKSIEVKRHGKYMPSLFWKKNFRCSQMRNSNFLLKTSGDKVSFKECPESYVASVDLLVAILLD